MLLSAASRRRSMLDLDMDLDASFFSRHLGKLYTAGFAVIALALLVFSAAVGQGQSHVCESLAAAPPRPVPFLTETPIFNGYFIAILHHSNLELLLTALRSTQPAFSGHMLVIDNSDTMEAYNSAAVRALAHVYVPAVQLHFTQSQNLLQAIAYASDVDFFGFMHSDAELLDADSLLRMFTAIAAGDQKWGMVLTNYDALVIFNPKATRKVGAWDTYFFQYTSDIDYYERLRIGGWDTGTVGTDLVLHKVSGTIKSNNCFRRRTRGAVGDYGRSYWTAKWGGAEPEIGGSMFSLPFEFDLYKMLLVSSVHRLIIMLGVLTAATYYAHRKRLMNRITLCWGVAVFAVAVCVTPMRQLLFDAGVLSK
jgi:hypothetical protein